MQTLQELLERQWVKRDGTPDHKMVSYLLKEGTYIQSGDTFIYVGDKKPTIEKTMWHDDTQAGPAANFSNFYDYNMRFKRFKLNDNQHFVATQYYGDKTEGKLLGVTIDDGRGTIRPMTAEEVDKANAALRDVMNDYGKRLRTYWKKYSTQVHASGYWVDR
jgi:hypothetical protein